MFLFKPLNEIVLQCKLYEEQKHTLPDSFFVDRNIARVHGIFFIKWATQTFQMSSWHFWALAEKK